MAVWRQLASIYLRTQERHCRFLLLFERIKLHKSPLMSREHPTCTSTLNKVPTWPLGALQSIIPFPISSELLLWASYSIYPLLCKGQRSRVEGQGSRLASGRPHSPGPRLDRKEVALPITSLDQDPSVFRHWLRLQAFVGVFVSGALLLPWGTQNNDVIFLQPNILYCLPRLTDPNWFVSGKGPGIEYLGRTN